jgi:hypothetical protein
MSENQTTFWVQNPAVLFRKESILSVWPKQGDTLAARYNAMTRLVILLIIVGYMITRRQMMLIGGALLLVAIVMAYYYQVSASGAMAMGKREDGGALGAGVREGFTNPALYSTVKPLFTTPTKENPIMNVQLPEIQDNPMRKQAAPLYNRAVEKEADDAVKSNLDPRIFMDVGDEVNFNSFMRNFYANPSTTIPNDQGSFMQFLYGNMPSCKEGDGLQCEKKNYRHTNY